MPVTTLTMGPGVLTIGDVGTLKAFQSQVTNVRLTPSVDRGDPLNVLSGESVPGDRDESWTLAGTLVQDFGDDVGVWQFCFDNRGDQLPFVFVPNNVDARQATGTLTVEAVELGGDAKAKPTSDFEFQLVGDPLIAAVP